MIGFKVHAKSDSELNGWQFGQTFNQRGLSSCWSTDHIWAHVFIDRFRQWQFTS